MRRPVIVITFAYTAGLLLGQGSLYFPYTITLLSILCLLGAGVLVALHRLTISKALLCTVPALVKRGKVMRVKVLTFIEKCVQFHTCGGLMSMKS